MLLFAHTATVPKDLNNEYLHVYLPSSSHVFPMNPFKHWHVKEVADNEHLPPFWQGLGVQGSTTKLIRSNDVIAFPISLNQIRAVQ